MLKRQTKSSAHTVRWTQTIEDLLGDPRKYAYARPQVFNPIDPEPCDCCPLGIAKFVSYDGFRRCINCIRKLVAEMGWDEIPEGEDVSTSEAEAVEEPAESDAILGRIDNGSGGSDPIVQEPGTLF